MIPIAKNDRGLAHGVARRNLSVKMFPLIDKLMRATFSGMPMNVKKVDAIINANYRQFLVHRLVSKANGSRAKADWILLIPSIDHEHACVMYVMLRKAKMILCPTNIAVSKHVIARVHQRTTGDDDFNKVVEMLKYHLSILIADESIPRKIIETGATEFTTFTTQGKVIWQIEDGGFMAKTWVDASLFHKDDLKVVADMDDEDVKLNLSVPLPSND